MYFGYGTMMEAHSANERIHGTPTPRTVCRTFTFFTPRTTMTTTNTANIAKLNDLVLVPNDSTQDINWHNAKGGVIECLSVPIALRTREVENNKTRLI
jgi:hypothetical protein